VKLLVEEAGSEVAQVAYAEASGVRTTSIAYVEATSALARMRKGDRITTAQLRAKLSELERLWQALYVHAVDDTVIELATQNARDHALRAYDAVHLAGALAFAEGEEIAFACWDRELREAAGKHAFALVPERL
jgi:predicted nucleic acid-binding protein